ncbi:thiol peroxidase [bacterium]|jgi:thioredoxin-dependent peroxiredoxin|nr:thiol peroxidase [bacterium]
MPTITLKGNPVTIKGPDLKVGDKAPDFQVQGTDMADITLASTAGKTRIVCSVPSLDTSVCSIETKKFNEKAAEIPGVEILVISTDLPFAMKRWCGAEGVDKVHCASDHRDASFGEKYGVLIGAGPLTRCLARAIFVIGPDDKLKHVEYVAEIASEPDYAQALAVAKG